VEGDAVDEADEEERPVRAPFGHLDVPAVVDGQEYVCRFAEVRQGVFDGSWVGSLHEHERHGGAEEDDVGVGVFAENLTFQVPVRMSAVFLRDWVRIQS